MWVEINYVNSSFEAKVTGLAADPPPDIAGLRNAIEQIARSHVDAVGFLAGQGFETFVTRAKLPDGTDMELTPVIPVLVANRNNLFLANKHSDLINLVDKSWSLANAVGSFRLAIREHGHTGAFCLRALESVKSHFDSPIVALTDLEVWAAMSNALNLHRSLSDEMKPFAYPQRHGKPKVNLDSERSVLLRRTSTIVDRFCIYLANEEVALEQLGYDFLRCTGSECLEPTLHS